MPRPKLEDRLEFQTLPQVAAELGMSSDMVRRWIEASLLPPPSIVREETKVRLFDRYWVLAARRALKPRPKP